MGNKHKVAVKQSAPVDIRYAVLKDVYAQLQNNDSMAPHIQDDRKGFVNWATEDGWIIHVPDAESIKLRFFVTGGVNEKNSIRPESEQFQNIVHKAMKGRNMGENAINTSLSLNDKNADSYNQAYENVDHICIAKTDLQTGAVPPHLDRFGYDVAVSCATKTQLEKSRMEQITFLKGINRKDISINEIRHIGNDRVAASVRWGTFGGKALMYKSQGEWKLIDVTNGITECVFLEKNNVPKRYWPNCSMEDGAIQDGQFYSQ